MCAGDISCLPWSYFPDPWGCGVREPWLTGKDLLPTCLLGSLLCCLHHRGKMYTEAAMTAHLWDWVVLDECVQGASSAYLGHAFRTLNKYLGSRCGNTWAAATSVSPSSAWGWLLIRARHLLLQDVIEKCGNADGANTRLSVILGVILVTVAVHMVKAWDIHR